MTEKVFNIVEHLFKLALDYLSKEKDSELEELVIILSQTFYCMKDGKQYYLNEQIKGHSLFKSKEFWEKYSKTKLNEEINKSKAKSPNLTQFQIENLILAQIMTFQHVMTDFGISKEMILNLINSIFEEYHVGEETKNLVMNIMGQNK